MGLLKDSAIVLGDDRLLALSSREARCDRPALSEVLDVLLRERLELAHEVVRDLVRGACAIC